MGATSVDIGGGDTGLVCVAVWISISQDHYHHDRLTFSPGASKSIRI
jgi:hypothetical protein